MSSSYTDTTTETFTILHARYLASKVATDLQKFHRFYNGQPTLEWIEKYEEPRRVAQYLSLQLETAGLFHHGTALRDWARDPAARIRRTWKYATGVRASANKRRKRVME